MEPAAEERHVSRMKLPSFAEYRRRAQRNGLVRLTVGLVRLFEADLRQYLGRRRVRWPAA